MGRGQVDLDELALVAREEGWQAAVHDYLRAKDPVAYRYATDPQAATWRLLVSPVSEPRVLFLWPGLSVAPFVFAQDRATVTCACRTAAEKDYILARAAQQEPGRVGAYVWDGKEPLPEPDGGFDLVVAVGVLGGPRSASATVVGEGTVVQEARRLLREGGELLLAGPSRSHPRRLRRGLGLADCRRAMQAEGFRDVRCYGLLPSHRQPFFIIPLWSGASLQHSLGRLADGYDFSEALPPAAWRLWRTAAGLGVKVLRALRLTGITPLLMPGYGLVGRRGDAA